VGDGGGGNAVVASPGAAVENAGDGSEQDVTPVKERGALIEVGKAEEDCSGEEGGDAAEAALEEILHPAAEEDFFGECDGDKSGNPRGDKEPGVVDVAMEVKEAEGESDGDRDEHVEEELAEAGGPVAVAKAKAVPDAGEAADGEEGVKAGVKEGELAECGEFVGPGGLEPAEVDGEPERNEDEEIEKVAALAGVEAGGEEFEGGDESGEEEIDEEPANGQDVRVEGDDDIGQDEDCGNSEA